MAERVRECPLSPRTMRADDSPNEKWLWWLAPVILRHGVGHWGTADWPDISATIIKQRLG